MYAKSAGLNEPIWRTFQSSEKCMQYMGKAPNYCTCFVRDRARHCPDRAIHGPARIGAETPWLDVPAPWPILNQLAFACFRASCRRSNGDSSSFSLCHSRHQPWRSWVTRPGDTPNLPAACFAELPSERNVASR